MGNSADGHRSLPIVTAARRPSTSFVLAALRALHVDRLLDGHEGPQLSNDAHLHAHTEHPGQTDQDLNYAESEVARSTTSDSAWRLRRDGTVVGHSSSNFTELGAVSTSYSCQGLSLGLRTPPHVMTVRYPRSSRPPPGRPEPRS